MNISSAGLDLIKRFEGLRLEPYLCPAGVLTVGYGHTGPDVKPGQWISEQEADELLEHDIAKAEACVANCVGVAIEQGQFDALCSFVYNLGCAALRNSTLLRKLNLGDLIGAAEEFRHWNHSGGKELAGLTARRQNEAQMFATNIDRDIARV